MGRRKRVKPRGPVYGKLDLDHIRSLGVVKKPTLDYSWRRGAEVMKIPSLNSGVEGEPCVVKSIMDPTSLAKESPEVREAIVAKSKRLAPAYNKGAVQYITDETDVASIGRKNPI